MARLGIIELGIMGMPMDRHLMEAVLRTAMAVGYGDEDLCASIKRLENLAGVEVSDPAHRNRAG